jgi:hypothetical protein
VNKNYAPITPVDIKRSFSQYKLYNYNYIIVKLKSIVYLFKSHNKSENKVKNNMHYFFKLKYIMNT